jgi:uncharacterized protein YndB with AHSA1/START domain
MSTTPTGHYERVDGRPLVRFERTFPHPVAAVWRAITEPRQLEKWFPTTVEFSELRAGAPIAFRFTTHDLPPMDGAFVDVDEPRRLAFTWGEDVLTFALSERDGGAACRLAFSVVLDDAGKAARDSAGWESCLDRLAVTTAGQAPERSAGTGPWQEYYEHYKAAGFPATAEIPN